MATQIHGFGPNGELSPGATAALAGLGGGGATELDDLTDVDTTGATTGQVLTFDGSEWSPDAPSAGTVTSTSISDSTATGRAVLTAADAATARSAIGAGTSNLAIGTTGSTAAAGNDSRIVNAVPSSRTVAGKALSSDVTIGAADLSATGTKDSTTVLHGDNTWKQPAGGGGGSTPDVRFEANSRTTGGGFQEVSASGFTAINLAAAQGEIVTNVGGGTVGSNTWTVPVSGVYLLAGTLRIVDDSAARSVHFNMHTATADHPSGIWQSFGGTGAGSRHVLSHTRITMLDEDDQVRLVTYSDGSAMNVNAASLSAILLREA